MALIRLTRRKTLLINVALVVCSLLCCLTGLEAAARIWEQGQAKGPYAWELVASRRIQLDRFETADGGYTKMRPEKAYAWQDIPVQINSQGLRGAEVEFTKPPGTYRILNLGDSVVFGWGVRCEETYGSRLQEWLGQRYGSNGTRYQVVNVGVPGWNMENILSYLRAEGMAYQPDLIVLNFTVVNDVYGGSAAERSDRPVFEWLRDHTYFWPFLSTQYSLLEVRAGRRDAVPVLSPPPEAEFYFPMRKVDPRWNVVWEAIQHMRTLADAHGSDFLLIVLPTAFQVQDVAYPEVPQQVLVNRGGDEGIEVLDLLPAFRRACREAQPEHSCGPEGRYLWADMWMHPSPLGHHMIAEQILDVLEEKGWH